MAPIKNTKQANTNTNNMNTNTNSLNNARQGAGTPRAVNAADANNIYSSSTSGSSNSLSNFNHSNNNFNNNIHNNSFSNSQPEQNVFPTNDFPTTSTAAALSATPAGRAKYTGAVPKTAVSASPTAPVITAVDAEVTANLQISSRRSGSGTTMTQQPAKSQPQPTPLPQQSMGPERFPDTRLDYMMSRDMVATMQLQREDSAEEQRTQFVQQHQQQKRKNTEIVAPIRRELKDLNDYFLSTVDIAARRPASNTNGINDLNNRGGQSLTTIASGGVSQQQAYRRESSHQVLTDNQSNNALSYGVDNLNENQRFCYPVRPIPRRNHQLPQQTLTHFLQHNDITHTNQLGTPNVSGATTISATPTVSNTSNSVCSATVGIVTPTTPLSSTAGTTLTAGVLENIASFDNRQTLLLRQHRLQQELIQQLQSLLSEPLASEAATFAATTSAAAARIDQLQNQQRELLTNYTNIEQAQNAQRHQLQVQLQQQNQLSQHLQLRELQAQNQQRIALHQVTQLHHQEQQQQQREQQIIQQHANNKKTSTGRMVHDTNPNRADRDLIVNSASLEDVAVSETSDNRAQSIQSLHSAIETPTPESAPTYEELQMRLEISNQNIRTMQEQQEQLLRLQMAAKKQLDDMERIRNEAGALSFNLNNEGGAVSTSSGDRNSDGAPEYHNIEQVHSDMASLVGRMKNLTVFIQNQNELSNLLGDDGPEILAEQEALQRKLEDLRTQRDEMRNLVHELQDINRNAEQTARSVRDDTRDETRDSSVETVIGEQKTINTDRNVPVEYLRVVPIQMLAATSVSQTNGSQANDSQTSGSQTSRNLETTSHRSLGLEAVDEAAQTSQMIEQKVADIEAMKLQLKRLKEMMDTVSQIEERTARDSRSRSHSSTVSYDRERTPVAPEPVEPYERQRNPYGLNKMRMLKDVSSDLHQQAQNLHNERERIKNFKREVAFRKEQAAAAVQLGEEALLRNSLTPTPSAPSNIPPPTTTASHSNEARHESSGPSECDQLKRDYETKKKEFEQLCQRLQLEDVSGNGGTNRVPTRRHEIVSEADDEDEDDAEGADAVVASVARNYFATSAASVTNSAIAGIHAASARSAAQIAGQPDLVSLQSGSSRSFSIPRITSIETGVLSCTIQRPQESTFEETNAIPAVTPPADAWTAEYYGIGHDAALPYSSSFNSQANVSSTAPPTPPPRTNDSVCVCNAATSTAAPTNAGAHTTAGGNQPATGNPHALNADPMVLQQFVQTQQMLINSVCQCNQMLWHQQREMDMLNNTMQSLQDRICSLAGIGVAVVPDMGTFNIRAESVPPVAFAGGVPNNLFAGHNRAQSEQPNAVFIPVAAAAGTNALGAGTTTVPRNTLTAASYQQQQLQQQLLQQQQQHQQNMLQHRQHRNVGMYSFSNELLQHTQNSASSATGSIYSTLNNALPATQSSTPQSSHFNNETVATPAVYDQATSTATGNTGPGPIFMNHHNNAIHQNNANLRTQNHHANNLLNNIGGTGGSSGGAGCSAGSGGSATNNNNTLNNQVPPGNRANNYWDNFRSYSRQNLLSTNSNKSNEEAHLNQNQQQQMQLPLQLTQQQHQQQDLQRDVRQRHQLWREYEPQQAGLETQRHDADNDNDVAEEEPNAEPYETGRAEINVRQQHQAQRRHRAYLQQATPVYRITPLNNSNIGNNNLNHERNNNKHMRTAQRSSINLQNQEQQQQQQPQSLQQHDQRRQPQQPQQQPNIAENVLHSNYSNLYQTTVRTRAASTASYRRRQLYHPNLNWMVATDGDEDNENDADPDAEDDGDEDEAIDAVDADADADADIDLDIDDDGEQNEDDEDDVDNENDNDNIENGNDDVDVDDNDIDVDNLNLNQTDNESYSNYNIVDSEVATIYAPADVVQLVDVSTSSTDLQREANMSVNFGNSPHYQRQKVTTKVAATHFRNGSAARPQEQQALQPHFALLAPEASGSGAPGSGHASNRNRDFEPVQEHERGYLVRTGDDDANDYVFVPSGAFSFGSENIAIGYSVETNGAVDHPRRNLRRPVDAVDNDGDHVNNVDDEYDIDDVEIENDDNENARGGVDADNDDDDDDTTSEEIKRNLLANALKNEKFTSKVYESIKKDVFRRLESMLLEKDSGAEQQQHYQRLLAHLYHPNTDRTVPNELTYEGSGILTFLADDTADTLERSDADAASTSRAAAIREAANTTEYDTFQRYYVDSHVVQYQGNQEFILQQMNLLEENKSDQNNSQIHSSNANNYELNNIQNNPSDTSNDIHNNAQHNNHNTLSTPETTIHQNNNESNAHSIQNIQSIQNIHNGENIQNHNNNFTTASDASQDNLNVADDKKSKQMSKNANCRYPFGKTTTEMADGDNGDDDNTVAPQISLRYSETEAEVISRNVTVTPSSFSVRSKEPTRGPNKHNSASGGDPKRQPQLATIESDGAMPPSVDNDDDKPSDSGQQRACHTEENVNLEPQLSSSSNDNCTQPQEPNEPTNTPIHLQKETPEKEDQTYAKGKPERQTGRQKHQAKAKQNPPVEEVPKPSDLSEQPSTSKAAKQTPPQGKNNRREKKPKKTETGDETTTQSQPLAVDQDANATVDEQENDLIPTIIMRIRIYTEGSLVINDSMLVEITKVTSATVKSSIATCNPPVLTAPNLSPKRLYAKIKKQPIPRRREEFLVWYENYLSSTFIFQQQQRQSPAAGNKKSHKGGSGGGANKKTGAMRVTTTDSAICPTTSVAAANAAPLSNVVQEKDKDNHQSALAENVEPAQAAGDNNVSEQNPNADKTNLSTGENAADERKQ